MPGNNAVNPDLQPTYSAYTALQWIANSEDSAAIALRPLTFIRRSSAHVVKRNVDGSGSRLAGAEAGARWAWAGLPTFTELVEEGLSPPW